MLPVSHMASFKSIRSLVNQTRVTPPLVSKVEWSFNIRLYLESLDLFEHVDGTAEMPGEDPNSKAAKLFRQRAKKAWTYICLAVDSDQQIHVRDTQTRS